MRGRKFPYAVLLATALLLTSGASQANDLKAAIQNMGAEACTDMPGWECVTQDVPLDHHANGGPPIKIKYVIHFATEESKGVLVFAVGGPGQSGVAVADQWFKSYHKKLGQNMDIVFFDQRGIGPEDGVICPNAQASFNMAQPSIEKPDEAITIAKRYATDCPAEFKLPGLLNFLDTEQAIRDLEMFRQAIGSPKIWIYGASYGTQFAQQYATAFPTSVKGVIIDGVVDLSLGYDQYESISVLAAEGILTRIFEACDEESNCSRDMNGDAAAAAVYEALSARATERPIEVNFPQADGSFTKRELTRYMLESAAYNSLSGSDERAEFLRELAAASRGNLVPLLQLSYSSLMVDPLTLEAANDREYYAAAYYAITCSEYGEGTADGYATARQIIKRAKAFAPMAPRLLDFFYMERLVCAFWPKRGPTERPKPYAGGKFPTLIIGADTDPITPLSMSESVFEHAKKASEVRMVVVKGGPHVSWGYGDACVDNPVYDLVIYGKMPKTPVTPCDQSFVGAYAKLTLADTASAGDSRAVAAAVETEIDRSLELRQWDQKLKFGKWDEKKALTVACDFGGTVTASSNKDLKEYSFAGCAWWPGISLNGKGTKVGAKGSGSLTLDLAISGEHGGEIAYRRDNAAEAGTLSGSYDGKDVSAP